MRSNFFFWNGHGLVYFSSTQLFFQETNPFLLLFQISFYFCPDIGRRGLPTVDLISCHTPNKAIFQKARPPGFPRKLILHMHNFLQKEVERMSLGRNWWLGPSVTTLILPSFHLQQSLIWEMGNHYIVEIQGECFGYGFLKENTMVHWKQWEEEKTVVSCAFLITSHACAGGWKTQLSGRSPQGALWLHHVYSVACRRK